jgi:PAS domain S-box-containing protein
VNILTDITERKKAENALRQSEERFAKAFHSSPDAIAISRVSDGLMIDVNDGWVNLFGYDREEVIGLSSLTLNLIANPEARQEVLRRLQEKGSVKNLVLQIRRKSGELRLVDLSSEKIQVNGEDAILSVLRDITEQNKVERALQASEAKMRAVFRALTEGVVFLNRDGVVEEANDAVQLSFDHTLDELTDPDLDPRTRIIRPDGTLFPVEEQPAMHALRTGETVRDVEMGVPLQNGQVSWRLVNAQPVLDDSGNLLGVVASFFDITERRKAEQALRESEERFRSLADSMPQLVWTALPDGRVDYYNKRSLEYQNIKQVREHDWEWAPVLHPDDSQPTVDAWLHALETGENYQIEHRVKMADGSYRWHLSRGVPILDDRGRIIRWFGTATDIHDLKLAEEQLKIYASRLEKSNRELEQFAFMASHDLQEPLRKIEMFGDMLLERSSDLQDNERNYLDRMRNAASRMRAMIEGLLQISRVATQGKPFVQVDLSGITSEVLSDFEEQIQRSGGKVEVEALPVVTGDPLQLRQLMQNLIGNALKYRQSGKPPQVRIYASHFYEKVQICVEDKGIGFPTEDADRIFEPFQRLVGRNEYEGSGIGLAICRRIVERHGGEIAAISEPGQGTTFIVTLPDPAIKQSRKES